MQEMLTLVGDKTYVLEIPMERDWVMPGIRWGKFEELFTAAYWCGQAWQAGLHERYGQLRLGRTLAEETAACLLGGYGMKAEMGLAVYRRLRDLSMLTAEADQQSLENVLAEPVMCGGREMRYRFPRQKARYLVGCLKGIPRIDAQSLTDVQLRDALTELPGIGPKTASWIVRNHRNSEHVAVLDVHIVRAGQFLGLFPKEAKPQRDYLSLEKRFLGFAEAIRAPASRLDALMWQHMRLLQYA